MVKCNELSYNMMIDRSKKMSREKQEKDLEGDMRDREEIRQDSEGVATGSAGREEKTCSADIRQQVQ